MDWGPESFLSYGSAYSRGTAIFISNSTDYKIHNSVADSNGNFCAIDISVSEYRLTLLSLYGPNIVIAKQFMLLGKPWRGREGTVLLPGQHAHPLVHEGPLQVPAGGVSVRRTRG